MRIASLVPSLTEAIAVSSPGSLIAATDWCTHPAGLNVTRIRGTKNPNVEALVDLSPDLIVANEEENREVDLQALRDAGLNVWVSNIRTVAAALIELDTLMRLIDAPNTSWLDEVKELWDAPPQVADHRIRAIIPIWRKPWMFVGSDTYAGDALRLLGVDNVMQDNENRYPKIDLADLPPAELAVLPDEPYVFTATDGPEAFRTMPSALVSGRALTWYGPAMLTAVNDLVPALRQAITQGR